MNLGRISHLLVEYFENAVQANCLKAQVVVMADSYQSPVTVFFVPRNLKPLLNR